MPTVKTNLVSYNIRDVNTRYGEKKVTEFVGIDGTKYSTWKAELASQVKTMLNQPVIVDYTVQKRGDFENFYIDGVYPESEAEELGIETPVTTVGSEVLDSKSLQINRAVALKAAVATPLNFKDPQEVIALAKVYEGYLNA